MITSETRTNNKNRLLGIFQIVAEMLSEVRCGTIWHSTRDIAIENVPPSSFAMLSEVLPAIIRHSRDAAIENVPPFSFAESRKVFWGVFCERFSALLLASKGACGPAVGLPTMGFASGVYCFCSRPSSPAWLLLLGVTIDGRMNHQEVPAWIQKLF
jgi:hypothetical protein